MTMEEFRAGLASEARDENEKLKVELDELKSSTESEIAELKHDLEKYKTMCRQLGNRCFVHTQGVMCANCGVDCCDYALTNKDWEKINHYSRSLHKVPMSAEDYAKVANFVKILQRDKIRNGKVREER